MVFICQSFAKVLPFCNCLKGLFEAAPRKIYGLVKLLYYCPFYLNYLSLSITVGGYSRINPPFIVARMNKCFIFAPSSCRYLNSLIRVKVVGWGWHCGKAFTWRFGFDTLRISQILSVNQKQSSGRCHGICLLSPIAMLLLLVGGRAHGSLVVYIHIGVGSALLVSINWAMREPLSVRRVTGTGSHAFLFV